MGRTRKRKFYTRFVIARENGALVSGLVLVLSIVSPAFFPVTLFVGIIYVGIMGFTVYESIRVEVSGEMFSERFLGKEFRNPVHKDFDLYQYTLVLGIETILLGLGVAAILYNLYSFIKMLN